jgi:transposase, IS5 family
LTHVFRVFTTGQTRRITPQINRQMKRRAAVETVIGHIKNDHWMNRCWLAHSRGDATNAILAAAGYNFSLILNWIKTLWLILCWALFSSVQAQSA